MRSWFRRPLLLLACAAASVVPSVIGAAPAGAATTTTTTGTTTTGTPVCKAVTRRQVTAALSKPAGTPKASKVGGVATCTWTTKSGVKVTYSVRPLTTEAKADLDRLASDGKNLVIAGVGDKSIAQCTKGGPTSMECQRFGKLSVLHGDEFSVVTISGLPKGYSVENELTALLQLGRNSQGKD